MGWLSKCIAFISHLMLSLSFSLCCKCIFVTCSTLRVIHICIYLKRTNVYTYIYIYTYGTPPKKKQKKQHPIYIYIYIYIWYPPPKKKKNTPNIYIYIHMYMYIYIYIRSELLKSGHQEPVVVVRNFLCPGVLRELLDLLQHTAAFEEADVAVLGSPVP